MASPQVALLFLLSSLYSQLAGNGVGIGIVAGKSDKIIKKVANLQEKNECFVKI